MVTAIILGVCLYGFAAFVLISDNKIMHDHFRDQKDGE